MKLKYITLVLHGGGREDRRCCLVLRISLWNERADISSQNDKKRQQNKWEHATAQTHAPVQI